VRLVDPEDVLDKMVYALTNPVKDGLVDKAHHWPGVTSLGALLHRTEMTASRPKHFFRADGSMPESVTLTLGRPRGFEHLSDDELANRILERVAQVEELMAAERKRTGRPMLGRRAVLAQNSRGNLLAPPIRVCRLRRRSCPRLSAVAAA
jgi:hypothetical protein